MLATTQNTSAAGYMHVYLIHKNSRPSIPDKLHQCQRSKIDLRGTSFQSSPKINRMLNTRPFTYNESLQHQTIAVLLIKSLIFSDHSVVFTWSKAVNAFKQ